MADQKAPAPGRVRLAELDALRGLAATGVMLFHYIAVFPRTFPGHGLSTPIAGGVFELGFYGVLLFFAISGFVIAFTLQSTRRATDFAVRRFARLYPLYWAAMFVTLCFVQGSDVAALMIPPGAILANLTMVQGMFFLPNVDGVYWTLLVELCFYACMIALWSIGALARVERIALLWLALKIACWALPGVPSRLQILLVLPYIPFFLIGMIGWRVWAGERDWRQQMPCLTAIVATVAITDIPQFAAAALAIILILWATIEGHARWLVLRPLTALGAISYALYLLHGNIGFVLMLAARNAGLPFAAAVPLAIGAALLLATLLHRLVERPAERAILRWWKGRDAAPRTDAPSRA